MPVPPALAASSKPQQEFDYDFERKVMSNDASTSFDAFLAKPEVRVLAATCHHQWVHAYPQLQQVPA